MSLRDVVSAAPFAWVACVGLYLSYTSRWVQLRALPALVRLLVTPTAKIAKPGALSPRAALLTAMSTTIGTGNVLGPIVAIGKGGPGALLCYVLATVLGGATIFSEVSLAGRYRRVDAAGKVRGGPMQYLRAVRPWMATAYAAACALLLLGWTAANANSMAGALHVYGVPTGLTGGAVALLTAAVLAGGVTRIGRINDALVPVMCALYCGATGWIIFVQHGAELPAAVGLVWHSFWHPEAVSYGVGVAGVMGVLRHGLARALQANEAGVGTATIPHSLVGSEHTREQATLAMAAVYCNGFLCLLTGFAVILGAGPLSADTPFDMALLTHTFTDHLSVWGGVALSASVVMFTFGTIVGNSFNGAHCVDFVRQRLGKMYYAACCAAVVLGAVFDLDTVIRVSDQLILPVLLLNGGGVAYLTWSRTRRRGDVAFCDHGQVQRLA